MSSIVLAAEPLQPALNVQGKGVFQISNENGDIIDEVPVLAENAYAAELERALLQKNELIIDFSSLKTCLDPLREPAETSSNNNEEFEYRTFIYKTFDKKYDKFSSLERLVLRKIPMMNPTPNLADWDKHTQLYHGVLQLSSLTELDLSENAIHKELQCQLQFWGLENLKKLVMDKMGLETFPASVGRLRKLEVLSLAKNQLTDLPVTLQFCKSLRVLNLKGNRFQQIPAVVLHLEKLDELKRLENPLTPIYNMSPPRYTQRHDCKTMNTALAGTPVKFNPRSLQALCTQTIFSTQVDYWNQISIGPLQCKTLDHMAGEFALCECCKTCVVNRGGVGVQVLLLEFVELRGVPFFFNVCSTDCRDKTMEKYGDKNIAIQKIIDEKYEKEKREAEATYKTNNAGGIISSEAVDVNAPTRRRHRRKCAIM